MEVMKIEKQTLFIDISSVFLFLLAKQIFFKLHLFWFTQSFLSEFLRAHIPVLLENFG
jgi:hypothetical protein